MTLTWNLSDYFTSTRFAEDQVTLFLALIRQNANLIKEEFSHFRRARKQIPVFTKNIFSQGGRGLDACKLELRKVSHDKFSCCFTLSICT